MTTQRPTGGTKERVGRALESEYLILAGKGWDCWPHCCPKASFLSCQRNLNLWQAGAGTQGWLHSGLSLIFFLSVPSQHVPVDFRNFSIFTWLCGAFCGWRKAIKSWEQKVVQTQPSLSGRTDPQQVCGRTRETHPVTSGRWQHQLEKQNNRLEGGQKVWLISWELWPHWPSVCLVLENFLHNNSRRDQFQSESLCLPYYLVSCLL